MLKKLWIVFGVLLLAPPAPAENTVKISNMSIEEKDGLTQLIFGMSALGYLEPQLDPDNSQILIHAPTEIKWDIPPVNGKVIGLFEGYTMGSPNTMKVDVFPGTKITDSYSINDDPLHPKFVIELQQENHSKNHEVSAPPTPPENETQTAPLYGDPDELNTGDEDTATPGATNETPENAEASSSPPNGVKKIAIEYSDETASFFIYLPPNEKAKAHQKNTVVHVDIPATDWSQVETDERFLGYIKDQEQGSILTIDSPIKDWEKKDASLHIIKEYYVSDGEGNRKTLVIKLAPDTLMISELFKLVKGKKCYALKFKKKEQPKPAVEPQDPPAPEPLQPTAAMTGPAQLNGGLYEAPAQYYPPVSQNFAAAPPPPEPQPIPKRYDAFKPKKLLVPSHAVPQSHQPVNNGQYASPQPVTGHNNTPTPTCNKPMRGGAFNPMVGLLNHQNNAQTSAEGPIPAWVREAQQKRR